MSIIWASHYADIALAGDVKLQAISQSDVPRRNLRLVGYRDAYSDIRIQSIQSRAPQRYVHVMMFGMVEECKIN